MESVSVLLTCFSQLGERDLSPLFLVGTKRVVYAVLASSCKSNTANFSKRSIELDPILCEREGACCCLHLYCKVDLDQRRNSYESKSG